MRLAMSRAEVGDEQKGADPTVSRLIATVAGLLGKETGIFLPSGTMCNVISVVTHCGRGESVIMETQSHLMRSEAGGLSAITGAVPEVIEGEDGHFTAEQLTRHFQPGSRYTPRTVLVAVEQSCNMAGGTVWPTAKLAQVAACAKSLGMNTHMDGARLFNAVVASGESAKVHCQGYDSVWVDFSKGLGAPFGAVLCGTEEFMSRAWAWKHRLGGAMRQAGMMAAGCLYALENNIERLEIDHANARLLNDGLKRLPFIKVKHDHPESNIVFFNLVGTDLIPETFLKRLLDRGLKIGFVGTGYRAVTYADITAVHINDALQIIASVLDELDEKDLIIPSQTTTGAAPRSCR